MRSNILYVIFYQKKRITRTTHLYLTLLLFLLPFLFNTIAVINPSNFAFIWNEAELRYNGKPFVVYFNVSWVLVYVLVLIVRLVGFKLHVFRVTQSGCETSCQCLTNSVKRRLGWWFSLSICPARSSKLLQGFRKCKSFAVDELKFLDKAGSVRTCLFIWFLLMPFFGVFLVGRSTKGILDLNLILSFFDQTAATARFKNDKFAVELVNATGMRKYSMTSHNPWGFQTIFKIKQIAAWGWWKSASSCFSFELRAQRDLPTL